MEKKLGSALIVFIWICGTGLEPLDAFCQSLSQPSTLHLQEVQLSKAGKQTTLALRFSQPPDFVRAFVLHAPTRLVIDVGRAVDQSQSVTHAAADALVARLRIGSHPAHTRFVFDLKTDQPPPFSVEQQAHLVTAVLNAQAGQAEQNGQANAAQEVDTQVLFSLTKSLRLSQSAPPTHSKALPAPSPIVLTKKAAPPGRLGETFPRANSLLPAPVPLATPQARVEELPLQNTSPKSASQVKMAAVLHAPPATPAQALPQLAPQISSQNTRQPQTLSSTASQHLRRGRSLYTEGNLDGAILQWQKAAALAPTNAEVQYRLGLALQNRGDLTQAIGAFGESLRLNPNDANVHVHLARALEVKGDTQGALAAYKNALQLIPNSAHVHNRLGHMLVAEGNVAGAVEAWQQTIHLQPDYAYAYVSLGKVLAQQGQKAKALAVYERALLLDPQAPFVADVSQRVSQLRGTNLSEENVPRRLIRQNENGAGQPEISG